MATELQKLDTGAIILLTVLGFIFLTLSFVVFNNLNASCPSSMVRDGWAMIQTFGACMVALGISYFACTFTSNCYDNIGTYRTIEVYLFIFGIFSIVLIGICTGILRAYGKLDSTQNCDNKEKTTKTGTIFILSISCLIFVGCVGFLVKTNLETP